MYTNIQTIGLPTWDDADVDAREGLQKELKQPQNGLATQLGPLRGGLDPEQNMGGTAPTTSATCRGTCRPSTLSQRCRGVEREDRVPPPAQGVQQPDPVQEGVPGPRRGGQRRDRVRVRVPEGPVRHRREGREGGPEGEGRQGHRGRHVRRPGRHRPHLLQRRTYYLVPNGPAAQKPYAVMFAAMRAHDRLAHRPPGPVRPGARGRGPPVRQAARHDPPGLRGPGEGPRPVRGRGRQPGRVGQGAGAGRGPAGLGHGGLRPAPVQGRVRRPGWPSWSQGKTRRKLGKGRGRPAAGGRRT